MIATQPISIGDCVRVKASPSPETYTVRWISELRPDGLPYRRVSIETASGDRLLLNEHSLEVVTRREEAMQP